MCLAIPAQVCSVDREMDTAVVAVGEIKKDISLALVSDVQVGDFVLLHVGYALAKLDPIEAEKTLALFREMNQYGAES